MLAIHSLHVLKCLCELLTSYCLCISGLSFSSSCGMFKYSRVFVLIYMQAHASFCVGAFACICTRGARVNFLSANVCVCVSENVCSLHIIVGTRLHVTGWPL